MFDAICPKVYKQLRLRAGMTQAQLGTALGASRMTVMRVESGRARFDKQQEQKLKELAKCSDVEFAELVCEQLSELTGRRVGIHECDHEYRPTTAQAAAQALLNRPAAGLSPWEIRALQDRISLTQHLEMALEKSNAGLLERTRRCRDRLRRDQRGHAARSGPPAPA